MNEERFQKIITVNDESYETISHCVQKLIFYMYNTNPNPNIEYFRFRLKDSEMGIGAKDLMLEWVCIKSDK